MAQNFCVKNAWKDFYFPFDLRANARASGDVFLRALAKFSSSSRVVWGGEPAVKERATVFFLLGVRGARLLPLLKLLRTEDVSSCVEPRLKEGLQLIESSWVSPRSTPMEAGSENLKENRLIAIYIAFCV